MNKRRFLAMFIVLALVLTLLPLAALPAMAYPATDIYNHPKTFIEGPVGVQFQAARTSETNLGTTFRMIYVEGGSYTMGWTIDSDFSHTPHSPLDTAPVDVTVDDFYIAETETTTQLWNAVYGLTSSTSNAPKNSVSFYDVHRFLGRLYVLTGKVYRLATEAEWEWAAKGGKPGQALGHDKFLFSGSNVQSQVAYTTTGSAPTNVKSLQPNILGIYDMSGNLEEWVWNPWNSAIQGGDNPIGVNSPVHAQRTRRGGAYSGEIYSRYTCARQIRSIDGSDGLLGFRIALSADWKTCPWEKAGLPKPFDVRHPTIDDRYEPTNSYRDRRVTTGNDVVWNGDFVGIFGGATLKFWDDGTMAMYPHNVDMIPENAITGQWYTNINCAIIVVPEQDNADWQPNRFDGVKRLAITYTFMTPDMLSVQNDRETVFAAPFGKLERQLESDYAAGIGPSQHGGTYVPIAKPVLTQALVATENLKAGEGPVAPNHKMFDMSTMNNNGQMPTAMQEKDPRIIDGPDWCWWMGYGAGGEHTYRKDLDQTNFRFGVYSPAFTQSPTVAQHSTNWGQAWGLNRIFGGNWYTVNDVLLFCVNSSGTVQNHYIYNVAPDSHWRERNQAQLDANPDNCITNYTKDNAEGARKFVLAKNALASPATYPFRHLSLSNDERGDQRLFFQWPTHEAQGYPEEMSFSAGSLFTSTFRTAPTAIANCPGIPRLNTNGSYTNGNYTTCGGTFYTCTCPIKDVVYPPTPQIDLVELEFPFAANVRNTAANRTVISTTPGVKATIAQGGFNPTVAADAFFARNTSYQVTIAIAALPGYTLNPAAKSGTSGLQVKVNGIDATSVAAAPSLTGTGSVTNTRNVVVTLNSGNGNNIVRNVALTMPAPSTQILSDTANRVITVTSVTGTGTDLSVTPTFGSFSPGVTAGNAYAANQAYSMTFTLAPGNYCSFPPTLTDLAVTVNGIAANVTAVNATTGRSVTVNFPATGPRLEITDLAITMPTPIGGLLNNAAARTMTIASGIATAAAASTTPFTPNVAAEGAFDASQAYTMTFTLTPGTGRDFPAALSDLHVTVNGIDAVITAANGANRTATVTFPATSAALIANNITLSMNAPAWGLSNNSMSREIAVTAGNATVSVANNTPWSAGTAYGTAAPTDGNPFQRDTTYNFTFTLTPAAGYVFPAALTDLIVKVNGIDAVVTTAGTGANALQRTVRVTFPQSKGSLVTSVPLMMTLPVAGVANNDAARAITVMDGATVASTSVTAASAFTNASTGAALASGSNFVEGVAYRFTFTLTAGSASYFPAFDAQNPDALTVTMNTLSGTSLTSYPCVVTAAPSEYVRTVRVDFPAAQVRPKLTQYIYAADVNRSTSDTDTVALGNYVSASYNNGTSVGTGGTLSYQIVDRGTTAVTLSGTNNGTLTGGNQKGIARLKATAAATTTLDPAEKEFLVIVTVPAVTITFNAGAGTVTPATAQTQALKGFFEANGKLATLPTPTPPADKVFEGWFTQASGGNMVSLDTVFSAATTVYAQYSDEGTPPTISITNQPAATTKVTAGSISGSLSITASVTQGGTVSGYTWYQCVGAAPAAGDTYLATGTSLAIPTGLLEGSYKFYCVVSAAGTADVTSNVAIVKVVPVPAEITIVTNPAAATVIAGQITGTLTAAATATLGATVTYEWYIRVGATPAPATDTFIGAGASVAIPTDLIANTNIYCLAIADLRDSISTLATAVALITVTRPAIAITTQPTAPASSTLIVGNITGTMSIAATVTENAAPLSYTWYRRVGTTINVATDTVLATGSSISIPTDWAVATYNVYCVVRAPGAADVNSNVIAVNVVNPTITVTTQPAAATVYRGYITGNLSVVASANNGSPVEYSWRRRVGTTINTTTDPEIASGSSLCPIPTDLTATSYFYCVLSAAGCANVNTNAVAVTVSNTFTIATQPAAQTVYAGYITGSLTCAPIAAVASGATYSWRQRLGTTINTASDPVVGTSSSFAIPTTLTATTNYYCVVTVAGLSATGTDVSVNTNAVQVTVNTTFTISTQPTAQTVIAGAITQTVTCAIPAVLQSAATYSWRIRAGTTINTATDEQFGTGIPCALPAGLIANTFVYCVVTVPGLSSTGTPVSVNTNAVLITVTRPLITIATSGQPAALTEVVQGEITETLAVTGTVTQGRTITYTWHRRVGTDAAPATDPVVGAERILDIPTNLTAGTYYFYCTLSADGAADVNSSMAQVVVAPPPFVPVTSVTAVGPTGDPVPAMVMPGRNQTLQYTVSFNAGASASVVWSSSDSSVATVSPTGLVTTKNKVGIAVITARDPESGCTATFIVRVT